MMKPLPSSIELFVILWPKGGRTKKSTEKEKGKKEYEEEWEKALGKALGIMITAILMNDSANEIMIKWDR